MSRALRCAPRVLVRRPAGALAALVVALAAGALLAVPGSGVREMLAAAVEPATAHSSVPLGLLLLVAAFLVLDDRAQAPTAVRQPVQTR